MAHKVIHDFYCLYVMKENCNKENYSDFELFLFTVFHLDTNKIPMCKDCLQTILLL